MGTLLHRAPEPKRPRVECPALSLLLLEHLAHSSFAERNWEANADL